MKGIQTLPYEWMILIVANFIVIVTFLLINIVNSVKIKRITEKYEKFIRGASIDNIEDILLNCLEKSDKIALKNKEMENRINNIERNLLYCIQKVGVVRYNAFDDVGSDLSYSIALLDSNDDGVVISGLFSRDNSITYAKPVIGGKSKYALSVEELQAIEIARKTHRSIKYME